MEPAGIDAILERRTSSLLGISRRSWVQASSAVVGDTEICSPRRCVSECASAR